MANKVISIEIGNAVTRIVQMDYQSKHPKVYRHTTIQTPEGCITDGYINNDNPALAEAIKGAIAGEKMGGTKNVIFTIASSKILTREVMLPPIKANMIETTIQMNLSEYFPIDLSAHEVSNLVLENIKEGDNAGRFRVLIIAAEKTLIQSYEVLAKNIGMTLIQVDYVGNSIFQSFKNEQVNRCNMVLKVEETQTSITIVDHQNLLLQRNISYGIEEVIREVADRPAFGCRTYEAAHDYVKDHLVIFETLSDTAMSASHEENENSSGGAMLEARAAVTRSLSGFINAVSRVVDFYNSRYNVPIDRIYVCGMGGDLQGINTLLGNEMGIKTHVLKKLEELQWVATTDLVGFHCYAATIGASFNPVGLYSKAREDKEKHKTNYKALGVLILILAAVASAALFVPRFFALQAAKDENAELNRVKGQYEDDKKVYDRFESMRSLYTDVKTGDAMMENPNDSILSFFAELEEKLPTEAQIVGFNSTSTECTIQFIAHDKEVAAGIIELFRSFDTIAYFNVSTVEEEHDDDLEFKLQALTDALNNLITVDGEAVPIVGEEAAGENTEQTEVVQAEGTENVEGENTEELTDELTQYATDVRFTINAVYYSALDEAEADN
ncbi:MAG: pilus assembly protein PilM [Lachnospiraceae bacterium]|nr:pilus assembly protein PilM [Lachnospiraceae bacterium]